MTTHGVFLVFIQDGNRKFNDERIVTIISLHVSEGVVTTNPTSKHLEVLIERKLSFWVQIRYTSYKAAKCVTELSRLMTNTVT